MRHDASALEVVADVASSGTPVIFAQEGPACFADVRSRYRAWDDTAVRRVGNPINLTRTLEPSFFNHSASLAPLLHRLNGHQHTDEVVIGIVGGSVTVGAGLQDPSADAWPAVFQRALRQLWPNRTITVHNAARAATTAGFAALCYHSLFGARASRLDMLIIEYSWNTDRSHEMEALIQAAHRSGE